MITQETRREAYETAPRLIRRQAVLNALGKERLTAREIMSKMGFTDPNTVAIFKIKEDKNA